MSGFTIGEVDALVRSGDGVSIPSVNDGTIDRLAVDARIAGGITVSRPRSIVMTGDLIAGADKNMAVDGSASPVTYSFSPESTVEVCEIRILIDDHGDFDLDKFGAMNQLSSGVQLRWRIAAVSNTIATIKDNGDIRMIFDVIMNDEEGPLTGVLRFCPPVQLDFGDTLEATVSDKLKKLDLLRIGLIYSSAAQ